jgi:hypothetical protein
MKRTGNGWERMSTPAKTLDFARGCNSIQNQLVNFSYFPSFGTVRSEVRILSPRPINYIAYYGRPWSTTVFHVWPICGQNFLIYGMNHYRFGFFLQKPPKNDRS